MPLRQNADARPARLGERFVALVLDLILLAVLFTGVTRGAKGVWLMSPAHHRWQNGLFILDPICLLFLGGMLLYFVLSEGFWGATAGKSLMGLRVVSLDGDRPGVGRALVRNLLRLVDGLPALHLLGVFLILRSPQGVRFGDRVARTQVVRLKP
jgi:uncharacterized RDD family membrane protein YckC